MPNNNSDDKLFGQMLKSMSERNPKKRQIKPNSRNYEMLNLEYFEDTSSEDEDYRVPNDAPEDDEIDESDENVDNDENSSEEDDEDESEDEENSSSSSNEDNQNFNYLNNLPNENSYSISETTSTENKTSIKIKLNNKQTNNHQINLPHHNNNNKNKLNSSSSSKLLNTDNKLKKLLICSVCLSDESLEFDEIVECDCCSVTCHESCYGLSNTNDEVASLDSNASDNPTEPWFCDACKANKNMNELNCELCPKQGGIFKQTETGRWVHLVCALYINGVAFSNTQKLSGITLFEMNYERWSSKCCTLCEDERFACTGVCISCDAGMCRNYFHVTCAQANGLLCDAPHLEDMPENIADPFFAHCKQHAQDKYIVKTKKRNYLALQLRLKQFNSTERQMDERILNKLQEVRQQYLDESKQIFERKNLLQNLNYKSPRPLFSSSNAVRNLIKKAELLGMSPQAHIISNQDIIDIRKKWHLPVAFSVEFVGYYLDRNERLKSMVKKQDELNKQNQQLRNQEEEAILKYEERTKQCEQITKQYNDNLLNLTSLYNALSQLTNSKLNIPEKLLINNNNDNKTKIKYQLTNNLNVLNNLNGRLKCCGICKRSKDQSSLALCDNCNLYYHFQCLDPPLTRMPKKTKFGGWQCSECTEKCTEKEEEQLQPTVDINESRRLRASRFPPIKFIPDMEHNFTINHDAKRKRKRTSGSTKSINTSSNNSLNNNLDNSLNNNLNNNLDNNLNNSNDNNLIKIEKESP